MCFQNLENINCDSALDYGSNHEFPRVSLAKFQVNGYQLISVVGLESSGFDSI